jgi:hypothetical protein
MQAVLSLLFTAFRVLGIGAIGQLRRALRDRNHPSRAGSSDEVEGHSELPTAATR